MPKADVMTNIAGFEEALTKVKSSEPGITQVRLGVTKKVPESELGASYENGILVVGCNEADRYMVGVAIMFVFGQVPREHLSPSAAYNQEMLNLVRRQTTAMEDLTRIIRARA
jgi:hypothetical protein